MVSVSFDNADLAAGRGIHTLVTSGWHEVVKRGQVGGSHIVVL